MVGDELSFTSQSHGVDGMRLKDADKHHADYRYDQQGNEELVAAGDLGDQEDACQRSVHDTGHDACHAQQRVVAFGKINANLLHVPKPCEEKACEATHKQRRREGTTAAACTIGGGCGDDLREHDEADIKRQQLVVTIEQRAVHHLAPVCDSLPGNEGS